MNPHILKGGMFNARFLITLGVLIFFIIGLGYFFYGLQPTLVSEKPVEFKISKGESFRSISARLSQMSLIRSIAVFKLYSFLTGNAQRFQPGVYELKFDMSVPEIIKVLTSGGKNEVQVTIREGSTLKDIDKILSDAGVVKKGTLISINPSDLSNDYPFLEGVTSLEGFLFPDTYRFEIDSSSEFVVRRMLDNFIEKGWPKIKDRKDWYSVLILSSFLEREVPKFDDRRIVAGILLKRIKMGMPLQVDATLSYAKCKGQFLGCDSIRVLKEDLDIASPYNTYARLGWTPTPISNPGEEAIEAALNPKSTSYWYYLSAKETKETIFSRTLDEHNENRAKYLLKDNF